MDTAKRLRAFLCRDEGRINDEPHMFHVEQETVQVAEGFSSPFRFPINLKNVVRTGHEVQGELEGREGERLKRFTLCEIPSPARAVLIEEHGPLVVVNCVFEGKPIDFRALTGLRNCWLSTST